MDIDLKKQNSEILLRQANIISKGMYTLEMSTTSYKLIRYGFYLLQELNKSAELPELINEVEFSVSDFCNCLGISRGGNQKELIKEALQEIRKSGIQVEAENKKGEKKFTVYNWVYTAETDFNTIIIRFNPDLIKLMKDNIKQYSILELKTVGKIKSSYSLRIYELLKSFYNMKGKEKFQMEKGQWKTNFYTLEHMREYFKTGEKYKTDASFIQKCIKLPVEEINKVSEKLNLNFTVSYTIKKLGVKKQVQFIGTEVINSDKLAFNKIDTPELRIEKKEIITEEVEVKNFKKNFSSSEWDQYIQEYKKINPVMQNANSELLDLMVMKYIQELQAKNQPELF